MNTKSERSTKTGLVKKQGSKLVNLRKLSQPQAVITLFDALMNYLAQAEPQVPVKHHLYYEVQEWLEGMRDRKNVCLHYGSWGIIFVNIDWTRPPSVNGLSYGAKFLQLLGHMGEFVWSDGGGQKPVDPMIFIETFVHDQDGPDILEYSEAGGRDFIRVTKLGESLLQLKGSFDLGRKAIVSDGIPQCTYEAARWRRLIG